MAVFSTAVENPNGFNRLMYSWIEYKRTGKWPGNIPSQVSNSTVDTKFETESSTKVEDYKGEVKQNFIDNNDWIDNYINSSFDSFFKKFISYFKLDSLEGYFDELYGFIWFSQVLLFITSISLLILFLVYIFINIFIINKDLIRKKLANKNKLIQLYFKYQTILGHISFYFLPLLILIGLIENIYILYYLITHPLPLESLGIDIHTYISSKS
jgi:hypothetical protein